MNTAMVKLRALSLHGNPAFESGGLKWVTRYALWRKPVTTFVMLALAAFLTACSTTPTSTTATMYPVEGPLSKQKPLPVLIAKVDGITSNAGEIFLSLPDGELCAGRWSSVAPRSVGISTNVGIGSATTGMASAWATAFGVGYTNRNLPGVNRGEAMLVGDRGTVIHIEFYTGSGTANGTGVAKDNNTNIFRVLF